MNQERRNQIVELINQKRTIKNTELIERFGISIETVRRDLEYLENQGCLQRDLWRCGPEDFVGQ